MRMQYTPQAMADARAKASPSRWMPDPPPAKEMDATPPMHRTKPRKNRGESLTFRPKIHRTRAVNRGAEAVMTPVLEAVPYTRATFWKI